MCEIQDLGGDEPRISPTNVIQAPGEGASRISSTNIINDKPMNECAPNVKALNRYTTGKVHRVVKGDTRVAEGGTSGNQLRTTSIYR